MADPIEQLHADCEAARQEGEVTPSSQTQAMVQAAVLISKTIEAGFASMLAGTGDDEEIDEGDGGEEPPAKKK